MFKQIKSRLKSFIGGEDLFSNLSVLPFAKYKKNYSQGDYLNAYEISLYANRALSKRAEKVGEVEFQLKKGDDVIDSHPILDLLAKPNQAFIGVEFWKLYQKYYDIFGEVFIMTDSEMQMGGKVNEMHLMRSDKVKPFFNSETGKISKVEYSTVNGTTTIPGEQIVYAHNPSPANPVRGESLLQSGIRQVETATQIDEYHSKILENGGRVEGVFNFKTEKLTRAQLTELKEQFQEEYGNATKAGLPMFLAGGATYDKLALSPQELAYLETKKVTLNDIIILTGVPRAILGMTSEETFDNADASIRIFLKEVIKPLLKGMTDNLNENLVEEGLELTFVDPTPENREEKRKDAENGIKNYYLTPNEVREMMGHEPIDGGDSLLAPMNIVPLLQKPKETEEQKGCGCSTKSVTKSPSCRQNGESKKQCISRKMPELIEEGYGSEQAVKMASQMCSRSCDEKREAVNHPLRSRENREIYHALSVKRLDRRQDKFLDVINMYFEGQKERIIEKLSSQKHFRKKDLLSEIFYTKIEIKIAKETVLPILAELLKESAEDAKEIAGSEWEYNETPQIQSWLDKKTSIFAEQINDTTFDKLNREFKASLSEGESRQELIERIENTYGNISESRAATIARTEVHGVTQYGTMQGYEQAGMPIKIWVWAPGTQGGVRDNHQAMDGEEVPLEGFFSNGLKFPGDYSGGAGETINCQCFV